MSSDDTVGAAAVQRMWRDYCTLTGADPDSLGAVVRFGDSADMSDELLALVLNGTKRATTALVSDFLTAGDPIPPVGDHWMVTDGGGSPGCVLRTTDVRLGLLDSVDEAFAWDEGEGERTRDWWIEGHRSYFTRQRASTGDTFTEGADLVCFERFELVWPQPPP